MLSWTKHTLKFIVPGGTSRGVLQEKDSYLLRWNIDGQSYYAECGLLKGLSIDRLGNYEDVLNQLSCKLSQTKDCDFCLKDYPSIQMGLEMLELQRKTGKSFSFYPGAEENLKSGIPINGLIWMGKKDYMCQQIREKLEVGFRCLKIKIGAIEWDVEHDLLKRIREEYNSSGLELRVDANGAFLPNTAPKILDDLSKLGVHSIEQPIKAGQWEEMAKLCETSPVDIALDEELIGNNAHRQELLETIKPQYIILKPSLLGGFSESEKWMDEADKLGIKYWVTSALESNIGLNAIAQFTVHKNLKMPQGLGTGSLYLNNFSSPLEVLCDNLIYNQENSWNTEQIDRTFHE
jgi:o-succinylbenzoate synthase